MKEKHLHLAFDHGQLVYLKTDEEQLPRIITGILLRGGGHYEYELTQTTDRSYHLECELSPHKDQRYQFGLN